MLVISKNFNNSKGALVNENIKAPIVLVISDKGEQLGEKPIEEAIKLARQAGFDLVCVAPNAKVPVCRFMDYAKYRFEQKKRKKENRKKQKTVNVKEIWLTPVIGDHDFETKLRNGRKFLENGDKLKVTLRFGRRVRMLVNDADSKEMLERVIERTKDIATVEGSIAKEGRNMSVLLNPINNKK